MSYTFTKLFSSITSSTVWMEPAGTRLAWIALLANCDRKGRVFASMPGFAHLARITLEEADIAIKTFLSPDPYSRTPDNEGRRIVEIDGGWQLLNHEKYRGIRDEESQREAKAEYMRRKRAEEKSGTKSPTDSTVDHGGTKQKQIQSQKQSKKASPCSPPPGDGIAEAPLVPRETSTERNARKITFEQFIASLDGKPALPKTAPIHAYCRDAGIPPSMLLLAWNVFRQYHLNRPDKKQLDWRKVFDNYVRENYLRLWRPTTDGGYELTDKGEQASRALYASQGSA